MKQVKLSISARSAHGTLINDKNHLDWIGKCFLKKKTLLDSFCRSDLCKCICWIAILAAARGAGSIMSSDWSLILMDSKRVDLESFNSLKTTRIEKITKAFRNQFDEIIKKIDLSEWKLLPRLSCFCEIRRWKWIDCNFDDEIEINFH
jgi:hypothetical protein